jgi:hypothetical protein
MSPIDFVFIDGIAVGLLVADGSERRFCGATRTLLDVEGRAFCDVLDAQDFISRRLRRGGRRVRVL